jgi:hypothetical protein
LIAPVQAASADISVKIVVPKARRRSAVMFLGLCHAGELRQSSRQ